MSLAAGCSLLIKTNDVAVLPFTEPLLADRSIG